MLIIQLFDSSIIEQEDIMLQQCKTKQFRSGVITLSHAAEDIVGL